MDNPECFYQNETMTKNDMIQKKENNVIKHVCDICSKVFRLSASLKKHKETYSTNHKFYECCNRIENYEEIHICKKKHSKYKVDVKIHNTDNSSSHNGIDTRNNNDSQTNSNVLFGEDDSDIKVPKKKKKSLKKKENSKKNNNESTDQYKCQECSKSFNKYISLSQHIKIAHKKEGILKCQICDEEFRTSEEFEYHTSLHGPEDKVICKGCRKVFDTLRSYHVHAKQNPGIHCYECKLCLRQFPTELMLEQHVCICQNGKPLHCACGREFTKYQDVISHSKGTKPFHCCSCPHLSISLTAYIRHLRKHSKQKPYQCAKCDMKFAVIDFLNIHNKKHHGDSDINNVTDSASVNEHLCTICNEKFDNADDLKQHVFQHERVQCPDCGKLLKRNRLENHRNTHKTSASLCPECGKLFDTRFKLTQHIITTHNSEPVKCEVCMKVLKTKKILNEHMKTHLKSEMGGRVPQAICPMCGLGLAQKGSLARHILLTHEKHKIVPCDKTYTCEECSEVLPNKGKYYSHRRMHRAMVDRFPCEICGREFNKKQNLRRHIYLLHDEKRVLADPIFKCQICTRCFREKKNLKRHYKVVHKLEDVA